MGVGISCLVVKLFSSALDGGTKQLSNSTTKQLPTRRMGGGKLRSYYAICYNNHGDKHLFIHHRGEEASVLFATQVFVVPQAEYL